MSANLSTPPEHPTTSATPECSEKRAHHVGWFGFAKLAVSLALVCAAIGAAGALAVSGVEGNMHNFQARFFDGFGWGLLGGCLGLFLELRHVVGEWVRGDLRGRWVEPHLGGLLYWATFVPAIVLGSAGVAWGVGSPAAFSIIVCIAAAAGGTLVWLALRRFLPCP